MNDLRPTTGKAEFHLTYACDLECVACNRASFLRKPHTPNMTLDDAREFFRQADRLGWKPRVILVGGEPTLHRDFQTFHDEARAWSGQYVQVFSNGYSPKSQQLLQIARERGGSITRETHKPDGSIELAGAPKWWTDDVFVSPSDFGRPLRDPCYQHASQICGVSVDHDGYAPCAMGGALAALLGVGRTKVLADLFDQARVGELTASLCAHCGHQQAPREDVAACDASRFGGTPMSPTWAKIFEGRA